MVDSPTPAQQPLSNQGQILLETLASLSYREQDLDSYLYEITLAATRLLGVDWSVVTCCDRHQYEVVASSLDIQFQQNSFNLHGSLTGRVVKSKSLSVRDTNTDNRYGIAPLAIVPILAYFKSANTEKVIGTVCCFGVKPQNFSAEALSIAELLAERAAIAIDNYNLYHKQQDFNQALEAEVAKRTAQLQQAQAKLVEKEKLAAIGQFASMIVHEIRNRNTTILMGLTSLQQLDLDRRDRMRLSLAVEEGERLKRLLQEILLYAKPKVLQAETIELNQLLGDMSLSLQKMPEANQRKLQLVSDNSQLMVKGDRDKLKQVIINLIKNAFEAIEVGETVTCHLSLAKNPAHCCVSIINQGTPIPPEILPKLTEPFVSHKPGGTGLGLAIVKQIVTNHDGSLSIESDRSKGTKISFTLPTVVLHTSRINSLF